MLRWAGRLRVVLVLLALTLAIYLPVVASGYADLRGAENALQMYDYGSAARHYQAAAWKLPWETRLWEQAAIARAYANEPSGAITLFEWLSLRGQLSARGWEIYGGVYQYSKGGVSKAVRIWLAGLQRYPAYTRFYLRIAYGDRLLENYQEERTWMEKWLATAKGSAGDHYEMGLLCLGSDQQTARLELQRASSMESGFDSAVNTLEASLALADLETAPSRRLVVVGRGLGLVSEWSLAQYNFQQAVDADPQNAEAWAWLGEAQQQRDLHPAAWFGEETQQQNKVDAKAALDKALELDPNSSLVHGLRGLYWKRQGNPKAALAEYQEAAQLEPKNADWQAALGDAYTSAGDLVSALAAYQSATTLAPDNATYWRLLALFSAENGVQVLDVGLPAAKKAAEIAPNDPQVLDALGWTYSQAGFLNTAEQSLNKAIKIAPDVASAHLHLAETYLREGNLSFAQTELRQVVTIDADGPYGAYAAQLLKQYFP